MAFLEKERLGQIKEGKCRKARGREKRGGGVHGMRKGDESEPGEAAVKSRGRVGTV